MATKWILTHTHKRHTTHHPYNTRQDAYDAATHLPGTVEITEHPTLGIPMAQTHDELLQEAVQAHNDYLDGVAELKYKRQMAFARAVAGPVTRKEIGDSIGLAVRTISHIINGR